MKLKKVSFFIVVGMALLSCSNQEKYTTSDYEGNWVGDMNVSFVGGSMDGLDTIMNKTFTFNSEGGMISMSPGPTYLTITGNLSVTETGDISGTIVTTHSTGSGTETTYMNWTGSSFESSESIQMDMTWTWENTAPGNGYYIISGMLNYQ